MRGKESKTGFAINMMRWLAKKNSSEYKKSYSQCGEDVIMDFVFQALRIDKPRYLDVGAHKPIKYSNTFRFYELGSRGVVVEPNPELIDDWKKTRPADLRIKAGIGAKNRSWADFYILDPDTLSGFSKINVDAAIKERGAKLVRKVKIKMMTIEKLLGQYWENGFELLSVDTEGFDEVILGGVDWVKFRPEVVCAETLIYSKKGMGRKNTQLIKLMREAKYEVYADSYINTIFVKKEALRQI